MSKICIHITRDATCELRSVKTFLIACSCKQGKNWHMQLNLLFKKLCICFKFRSVQLNCECSKLTAVSTLKLHLKLSERWYKRS